MQRLENKVALVTGAAKGIGEAIGRRFIAEGARVWITDIDDEPGRAVTAALGERARYVHLDVGDESAWEQVIAGLLRRDGRLDVLVNNAGIIGLEGAPGTHDPEHTTLEEWRRVHRVNLEGVFLGCKHAIRAMRKTGTGSIINMSSRSGVVGIPRAAAYASSKAAVLNHTRSVALWCAEQGLAIRCNSVHPGAILTPLWDAMLGLGPEREARLAALASDTPLKRWGTPEEVAAMVAYLAADESAFVTGSEFRIDGGLTAGSAASPGK